MRIGELLLFAPGVSFAELDLDDADRTIDAFRRRVEGFYLEPARAFAADKNHAFACGLLCCTAIDFLARYVRPEREPETRFTAWLGAHVPAFQAGDLGKRLYIDFRHGLVHEGRVKNAGQFSFDFPDAIVIREDHAMIVNPTLLTDAIASGFKEDCARLHTNRAEYEILARTLARDFRSELDLAHANQK